MSDASAPKANGIGISLAILEEVARAGPNISANEIARRLELPRASAYRIINTLVRDEYLLRHPSMHGFVLGNRVIELAHLVAPSGPAQEHGIIASARAAIDEALHFVRFDEGRILIVDEDAHLPLRSRQQIRNEPNRSAIGRILLADYAAGEHPSAKISVEEHARIIAATTATGYAQLIGTGTGNDSRSCIAVPVRSVDGILLGAVALATHTSRFDLAVRHLERLHETARQLADLAATTRRGMTPALDR